MPEAGNTLRVELQPPNVIRIEKEADKVLHVVTEGPQGRPGEAANTVNFTQSVAADTWTINHNLGFRPNVAAYTVGGLEMFGSVLHLSNNTVIISFNVAVAGTARLV